MIRAACLSLCLVACTGDPECEDQTEIPYDGTDQDCDGFDQVDVDGDLYAGVDRADWPGPDGLWPPGVRVGVDCDDTDASVYPAAEDAPYDGVDADCAEDDDWDADDDGYIPDEEADGYPGALPRGDCDDTDPEVNPDAAERLGDDLDNDCDGSLAPRWGELPGFTGLTNIAVDATDDHFVAATTAAAFDEIDDVGVGFIWEHDMAAASAPADQTYFYGVTTDDPLGPVALVAGAQSFFAATSSYRDEMNATLIVVKATYKPSSRAFERNPVSRWTQHDAPIDSPAIWWDGGQLLRAAACGTEAVQVLEATAAGTSFSDSGFAFTDLPGTSAPCAFRVAGELFVGDRSIVLDSDLNGIDADESPFPPNATVLKRQGDYVLHIDNGGILTAHPPAGPVESPLGSSPVVDAAMTMDDFGDLWTAGIGLDGSVIVSGPSVDVTLDPPDVTPSSIGVVAASERLFLAIAGEDLDGNEVLAWALLAL